MFSGIERPPNEDQPIVIRLTSPHPPSALVFATGALSDAAGKTLGIRRRAERRRRARRDDVRGRGRPDPGRRARLPHRLQVVGESAARPESAGMTFGRLGALRAPDLRRLDRRRTSFTSDERPRVRGEAHVQPWSIVVGITGPRSDRSPPRLDRALARQMGDIGGERRRRAPLAALREPAEIPRRHSTVTSTRRFRLLPFGVAFDAADDAVP